MSIQHLNLHPITSLIDTGYSAQAWFFNDPQCNCMISNSSWTVPVFKVFLDTDSLMAFNTFAGGELFYGDTGEHRQLKTANNWRVIGSAIWPSFSFSSNTPWPVYMGYQHLTDTISRTHDNFVTITNISGADSVYISVDDNSGIISHYFETGPVACGPSVTITVPMSKVSGMNNTASGTLKVFFYKFGETELFGGKYFTFIKHVEFSKTIEIDNY